MIKPIHLDVIVTFLQQITIVETKIWLHPPDPNLSKKDNEGDPAALALTDLSTPLPDIPSNEADWSLDMIGLREINDDNCNLPIATTFDVCNQLLFFVFVFSYFLFVIITWHDKFF